tara:strand:+ start:13922 stop:15667 length:1746 start_codon:yes stop_codon:yes gene_type:complete
VRSPSLLSLDGVSAILDERAGPRSTAVTLVLWNAEPGFAEALLARSDVASVILTGNGRVPAVSHPERCGWWDPETEQLVLPTVMASEMHYFVPGGHWPFGIQSTYHLLLRKVWRVVLHDIDFGTFRTNMAALLLNALSRSGSYRLSRTTIGKRLYRVTSAPAVNAIRRRINQARDTSDANRAGIMLVAGSLGPGGSERQTVNTLLGLSAAGISDLSLLHAHGLVPPHDFFHPVLKEAGITCLHLEEATARASSYQLPPDQRAVLLAMGRLGVRRDIVLSYLRIFREKRPEVVHTWLDDINVTAGIAAVLAGVPKVIIGGRSLAPDHFPFHQSYMRPIYRILAEQPNVTIINNSAAGARDYNRWAGLTSDVEVIRNGFVFDEVNVSNDLIAKDLRKIAGADANAQLVGTVMRLSAEKQPHLWLDIAARVGKSRPNTHFVIMGDGPLMGELANRVDASELKGRVSFLGRRQNAAKLLAGLDVFLLTSSVEGLPNVVVEAQSEGVPVVASDVGGVGEVFVDGQTGLLVRQRSADAFADAVLKTLADSGMRQRAHEQAPVLMRQNFSVDRMIDETLKVYGWEPVI